MAPRNASDLHELVGAYALDALEGDEVQEFEVHLETCPRCRAELRDHRDTASFLAHAGATAPDGVWDRIAQQLDEAPPDIARVLPFNRKRRRWVTVVSIAAALLVAVNSAVLIQQRREIRDLSPSSAANLQALAERALEVPGAQRTQFLGPDGAVLADAVVTPEGHGYLLHMSMHTLDSDHAYQLWGLTTEGDMVSLGVLGGHPRVASFSADLTITKLAITIERAHGAVAPTSSPIVTGTLERA
jgi:anti-sigma-K factor RskA